MNALSSAQRVIKVEAEALYLLIKQMPADLQRLVEDILTCTGTVIVSGVGKSGHIGRKISATLASTGTPSYFVHATEASHGDLGMLTASDLLLLISNSGETAELSDLIAFSRRFSIPMAAISSVESSALVRAADYKLVLPKAPEACHIGMAPTTSTTLALAMGDALAVALMERREFSPEDFQVFHPGGKLGAQLSQVEQLMHGQSSVPIVSTDMPMSEVLIAMTSGGFGVAAVTKEGILTGVVTDGDLRRNINDLIGRTAGEIASNDPITVPKNMLAASALATMNEHKITALVVVDNENRPIGMLHLHDLLRAGVA